MLIYKKEIDLLNEKVNFIFGDEIRYIKEEDIVFIVYCNDFKDTIYKIYKYI